jgi:hypothetical protein
MNSFSQTSDPVVKNIISIRCDSIVQRSLYYFFFNFLLKQFKKVFLNKMSNPRQCGTVLTDHPDVLKQADIYPYISVHNFLDIIPEEFNGYDAWSDIINTTPHLLPLSGDWAYAATVALNIKMNIYSYKNFFVSDYNKSQVMLLINKPPKSTDLNIPSTLYTNQDPSIFNGYSLYDAFEFCYEKGFSSWNCFNAQLLKNQYNINMETISKGTFEDKLALVEKNTSKDITKPGLFDLTHCIHTYNVDGSNKYLARHFFTIDGILNVGEKTADIDTKIKDIQAEIYRFGPPVAGMLVYDDFIKSDGKGIYTGPSPNSKIIGGHSLVLLGWGKDDKIGKYWNVYSCWDDFGELGMCKIKMGIPQCKIEYNVIGFIPRIPNNIFISSKSILMKYSNPSLKQPYIDPLTFYTKETSKLLEMKILVNNYKTYDIIPLIENKNKLIPSEEFIAANIRYYSTNEKISSKYRKTIKYNLLELGTLIILCVFIFIFCFKKF